MFGDRIFGVAMRGHAFHACHESQWPLGMFLGGAKGTRRTKGLGRCQQIATDPNFRFLFQDGMKEILEEEEQGENWHLIIIVSGYNAQKGSTPEHLAMNLCEASYGAEKKSLIVVLESNIGSQSLEPVEAQGLRGAKEINRLVQQNRQQGRIFSGYSLVGHSLGGLVARVIAVHVDLTPRVFVSLFTPHAGVGTFVSEKVMPPLLSITGIDKGTGSKGAAKDILEQVSNRSVLVRLAQGEYVKAFRSFEKRVLYGSPADWLVDFSSAILTHVNELQWSTSDNEIDEYPLLHIRSFKQQPFGCDEDTVRCRVLDSIVRHEALAIERVQVDWSMYRPEKHSQKEIRFFRGKHSGSCE
eukprot:s3424_g4.t1